MDLEPGATPMDPEWLTSQSTLLRTAHGEEALLCGTVKLQ